MKDRFLKVVVSSLSTDRITLTSHTRRHTSARSRSLSMAPCRHTAQFAPAAAARQLQSVDAAALPPAEIWICFQICIEYPRAAGCQMRRLRIPDDGTWPRPPSVSADRELQKLVDPGVSTPGIPDDRSAVLRQGATHQAAGPSEAARGHQRAIDDAEQESNPPFVSVRECDFWATSCAEWTRKTRQA